MTAEPTASRAFVTIVTNDYLFWALALVRSIRAQYGECACVIYVIGALPPGLSEEAAGARLVRLEDLRLPAFFDMAFRYTPFELACALKPRAIEHALATLGYEEVIYLDADNIVVSRLEEVEGALAQGASLVVTPHITEPHDGADADMNLVVLRAGRLNAGFLAARREPACMRFLDWWCGVLETGSRDDIPNGYFVDQIWMQHAPGFVEACEEVRHPGYNVGYWNLARREIARAGSQFTANGAPLRFFHRSGANLADPTYVSRHGRPMRRADLPALDALLAEHDRMLAAGRKLSGNGSRYDYATLSNGAVIPAAWRRAYALTHPQTQHLGYEEIFAPGAAWNSPAPDAPVFEDVVVTASMHELWRRDVVLQRWFDIRNRGGQVALTEWFAADTPSRLEAAERNILALTDLASTLGEQGYRLETAIAQTRAELAGAQGELSAARDEMVTVRSALSAAHEEMVTVRSALSAARDEMARRSRALRWLIPALAQAMFLRLRGKQGGS